MADKIFPVDISGISAEALAKRVLPKYRVADPVCSLLMRGVNDTYTVNAKRKRYYLRVYQHGWRSKTEITSELDVLNYLRHRQCPVSYPIRRRDGKYLTRINAPEGVRYAVLFSEAPGTIPDFRKLAICRQYGEIVGRMHETMDRRRPDTRRFDIDLKHLIDDPLAAICPLLVDRPGDIEFLRDVGAELKCELGQLPIEQPFYGFCHGDHHGGNVHADGANSMTVFDFDCYGYGWRAYDVAVFRWSLGLRYGFSGTNGAKATRRWNAFMDGYSGARSLTTQELNATALFVPARHIWLVGLHARLSRKMGSSILQTAAVDRHIEVVRQSFAAASKLS